MQGSDDTPVKRSVRLRVIGGSIELREDVPATRADCRGGPRPCPHVRCYWHLWLVEGHDRPGAPRRGGGARSSELRPVWIWRWPLPPSCALDVAEDIAADRGPRTIGRHLDLGREQVRMIINRALAKLRDHSGEIDGDDASCGKVGAQPHDSSEPRRRTPLVPAVGGDLDEVARRER